MPRYRVYKLVKGHVHGLPLVVDVKDDVTAIREAKILRDGHNLEIWEGARLVSRFEDQTHLLSATRH